MKVYDYRILGLLFILFSISSHSQQDSTYFYYYKREKIFLELDIATIALSIESNKSPEAITFQNVSREKLTIQENNTRLLSKIIDQQAKERKNIKTYYAEISATPIKNKDEYHKQIEAYKKDPSIIMASPCFVSGGGGKMGLSNNFYVKLKDKNDADLLYNKAQELNLEVLGHNEFMPLWFTLSCGKSTNMNALEAANLFYETGLFESAEPEFMYHDLNSKTNQSRNIQLDSLQKSVTKSTNGLLQNLQPNFLNRDLAASPNDPYYIMQWGLRNQSIDQGNKLLGVRADSAWPIAKDFNNSVKVAVIDNGIEMNHPDLKKNMHGQGYDVPSHRSPSIVRDLRDGLMHHGTCVAGVIAAVQNNNIGVSGIAPDAKLISVSIDQVGGGIIRADAINWAWNNKADVINCSWVSSERSALVQDAISDALIKGRDGKGAIVVFAIGNNGIKYSSNHPLLSNLDLLVVGATDASGKRLQKIEYAPESSSYGAVLDVMAPGESIATTDLIGKKGMNTSPDDLDNKDYTFGFSLSSAATPFVSGLAALILKINPSLSRREVTDIIEKTARKMNPTIYKYSQVLGHPNGAWNEEMGYGLIDAEAAVKLAKASLTCQEKVVITKNTVAPKSDKEQGKEQILESSILNSNDDTQASEFITASNVIEEGENVIYHAGKSVELIPGFIAKSGCVFEADIEACLGNSSRKINIFFKEKITYAFRYNTTGSIIAKNQNADNQNQLKAEPNPFTNTITINYSTFANSGKVSLDVYTMEGKKVINLVNDSTMASGTHTVVWDASRFPSGMYLVKLTTADEKKTIKVVKL